MFFSDIFEIINLKNNIMNLKAFKLDDFNELQLSKKEKSKLYGGDLFLPPFENQDGTKPKGTSTNSGGIGDDEIPITTNPNPPKP